MLLVTVLALSTAEVEMPALNEPLRYAGSMAVLIALALALCIFNRHREKSAVLHFEELPPDVITTLGLVWIQPSSSQSRTTAGRNRLNPS